MKICSCTVVLSWDLVLAPVLGTGAFLVVQAVCSHHALTPHTAPHVAVRDAAVAAGFSPIIALLSLCGWDFWFYNKQPKEQNTSAEDEKG